MQGNIWKYDERQLFWDSCVEMYLVPWRSTSQYR